MKNSNHMDGVRQFSERFGVPIEDRPSLLDDELFLYRLQFLHEELNELLQAHRTGDLTKAVDALLDLEYVLHGTAIMMGLNRRWHDLWTTVHLANMAKIPTPSVFGSKRKSKFDVIKPPNWKSPEDQIKKILADEIDNSH